jgi:hypothetical protein
MAYSLSLAHSVIPHHHHHTAEEAAAHNHAAGVHHKAKHHHTSNQDHHHHGNQQSDSEEHSDNTGHFFFFSHDANTDVLIKHGSTDNPVKNKKVQALPIKEELLSFEVSEHLVFHPLQDDPSFTLKVVSSRSLRAPPYPFV